MTPKVAQWLEGAVKRALEKAAEGYDVPDDFTPAEEEEARDWLFQMADNAYGIVDGNRGD